MYYQAKYKMNREQNVFWAKRNIVDYIWKSANLEGIAVTFLDTQNIYEGITVSRCSVEDIVKINNLKHAWHFLLETLDYPMDYPYICKLHEIVGANSIYNAGYIRTFPVKMGGTTWQPQIPIESVVKEELEEILQVDNPIDRGLELCLYCMRRKMFADGNKRVAILAANQILIKEGMGVLSVAQDHMQEFKERLIAFYETNEKEDVKQFLYEKCIDGENIDQEAEQHKNPEKNYSEEYFKNKAREFSALNMNVTRKPNTILRREPK